MPSFSRCVLGVLAGMLLASPGSAMAADSSTCTPATIDGTFVGQKLRLAVDQPTGQVRVCFRAGAVAGGVITITGPGGSAPLPTTDANDAACRAPGNSAPGPHPLADGTILGAPVYLETYQTANQVWVCASSGTQHERLIFTTPGATPPSVTYEQDPDIVFPPPPPDRCQVAPQACQPPPDRCQVAPSTCQPPPPTASSIICKFEGVAGNITPGVMLQGGSGTYDFQTPPGSTTTQCSSPAGFPPENSSIESIGQFNNIICGTGTAWSGYSDVFPADRTVIRVGSLTRVTSAEYTIEFRALQGSLKIRKVNGAAESGGDDVDGHVTIVPTEGSCTTGVTAFEVTGAFHAEW